LPVNVLWGEITRFSPGPYLEPFARSPVEGWTTGGYEVPP